jgi:hypothetical protein
MYSQDNETQKENFYRNQMLNSDDDESQDYLEVDIPLPGQNYGCISFISPEKEIAQKQDYYAYNFYKYQVRMIQQILKHKFTELKKSADNEMITLSDINETEKQIFHNLKNIQLTDIVNKNLQEVQQANKDDPLYQENLKKETEKENEEKNHVDWSEFTDVFNDEIKNYLCTNEDRMQDEYNKHVEYQTNIRGIKLRGNFESFREAKMRAKLLRKRDPSFHVWVGQVGYWLPVDADPDKAQSSEYMDERLQKLAEEKLKNEKKREYFYQLRAEEEKKAADVRNKKIREEQKQQKEQQQREAEQSNNQNDGQVNLLEGTTPESNPEPLPIEEPTETLSINKIEELLNQRKHEIETAVNVPNQTPNEINQSGFDNIDPWMARKVEEVSKENDENDDDN